MAELKIDPSIISSLKNKVAEAKAKKAKNYSDLKKLDDFVTNTIKDYKLDAVTGEHIVVVDDEVAEKFTKVLELFKEGKVSDAVNLVG